MKFSIKDLFSKCDQIRNKLRILPYLLKKSLMENFNFCAVRKAMVCVHLERYVLKTDQNETLCFNKEFLKNIKLNFFFCDIIFSKILKISNK